MNPHECIFPLVGMRGGKPQRFLGTSSLVGANGLLLTAEHVIRDWDGEFSVVCMSDLSKAYNAAVVERDARHDLALLRVDGLPPAYQPLVPGFGKPIIPNVQVVTYEYGTTQSLGQQIRFSPATRLGNVARVITMELLGGAGKEALEISFPALKGASGAPVMDSRNFEIWGVIVANVSYELLPLQIESVIDEKNGLTETTKFMLPQAAAVNINHLEAMYRRHAT